MFINWKIDDKGRRYVVCRREGKIHRPELSWFPKRDYGPWFTRYPLLHLIVQWYITLSIIYPKVFSNYGSFKPGDLVVYNWKAYIQIYKGFDKMPRVRQIERIEYSDKSGLKFKNGESCDAFWVRKLWFWEKWQHHSN
jgi:hypothetical protein